MRLRVDVDVIEAGRWVATVPDLDALRAEGRSRDEALRAVQVLALRALADRLERGEPSDANPFDVDVSEGPGVGAVRSRFADALDSMRRKSAEAGLDTMTMDEINAEIHAARAERRRRASSE